MLWTVVVCDLIYKLQDLRDAYDDSIANKILAEVAKKQEDDPKNSNWEKYLLNQVQKRTKLIDKIEEEALDNLQKNRNLCAHPIINSDDVLYKPTKELTRALMRTALDSILLKSPLLSREYIEIILEDFANRKNDFLPYDENLKIYFQNRYLNHLNEQQIMKLYKVLWKFVFYPTNEEQIENQKINKELSKWIFLKYKEKCIQLITSNKDYFKYDISNKDSKAFFNSFIAQYSEVYEHLSIQTKSLFKSANQEFPLNIPFFFVYANNFVEHLNNINRDFENREFPMTKSDLWYNAQYLRNQAQETNELEKFFDLCINWYSNSWNYTEADILFKEFILPNYKDFKLEQIKDLIKSSSMNNQTYNRSNAAEEHSLILEKYIELNGGYDDVKGTVWEKSYLDLGGCPF